jgi:hypothetical protein
MSITILAAGPVGELFGDDQTLTTPSSGDADGFLNLRGDGSVLEYTLSSPPTTLWLHGVTRSFSNDPTPLINLGGSHGTRRDTFFTIQDTSGNILVGIRIYATATTASSTVRYEVVGVTGTGTSISQLYDTTTAPSADNDQVFDISASLSGGNLAVSAFMDGVEIYSGSISASGATWGAPAKVSISAITSRPEDRGSSKWREILVSGASTVGYSAKTLEATGAGTYSDGTGSYTDLTEDGIDTSTAVAFASAGDKHSFDVSPLTGASFTSQDIQALCFAFIARAASGVTGFRPFVRIGGTDYPGDTETVTAAYAPYVVQMNTNPATGVAWTASDLSGLEVGIEAV